jgi:hypothetical protein
MKIIIYTLDIILNSLYVILKSFVLLKNWKKIYDYYPLCFDITVAILAQVALVTTHSSQTVSLRNGIWIWEQNNGNAKNILASQSLFARSGKTTVLQATFILQSVM